MIKIEVDRLIDGMVLASPVICPNTGKILMSEGQKLTAGIINTIKNRGVSHVAISDQESMMIDPVDAVSQELSRQFKTEIHKFAPEVSLANMSDKMVDVSKFASRIANEILEDRSVAQFCIIAKLIDEKCLYPHNITTCVLSILVSGAMNLNASTAREIGTGALLHDVGLCEMPNLLSVIQRTEKQEQQWQEHARYGYYFAKESGISSEICNLILHHHEKFDGSGFPDKLAAEDIPIGARIIAVCETYDRLIRFENKPHYEAIKFILQGADSYFDRKIVDVFTQNIPVYPMGSIVRLSTGEVGVVINIRKNKGPLPIVRVYYNRVNRPITAPYDIDLATKPEIYIQKIL